MKLLTKIFYIILFSAFIIFGSAALYMHTDFEAVVISIFIIPMGIYGLIRTFKNKMSNGNNNGNCSICGSGLMSNGNCPNCRGQILRHIFSGKKDE